LVPRQIAPGSDWLAISPDAGNLLVALKTNGTLWLRSRRFNAAGVDGLTQVGSASDWRVRLMRGGTRFSPV
jgi:hypothetical protein